MKNNLSRKIYGLTVVVIGFILFLGVMGMNINIHGWWTIFIIVPCIVSIITSGFKFINVFGLLIGFWLLAKEQGILHGRMANDLFFPIIVITFGTWLLFGKSGNVNKSIIKNKNKDINDNPEYVAIFSGNEVKNTSNDLKGATVTAIFGGVELDMSSAKIKEDISMEVVAVFGGIEIKVPDNVKVIVNGVPIFGGTSNITKPIDDDKAVKLTINSVAIFGGVEIK